MDEKTAELRDIFVDVTDAEEVTESQSETRGTLADHPDVEGRLAEVVAEMREACAFDTSLSDADLVRVVRGFYRGEDDAAIARDLDVSRGTVVRARLDLHLLRDADVDPPFDFDAFRRAVADGESTAALADTFDVSESTVRRYRRVVAARAAISRVNDRFRSEFENALRDRELLERMTEGVSEDGLEEATEGQEVDLPL